MHWQECATAWQQHMDRVPSASCSSLVCDHAMLSHAHSLASHVHDFGTCRSHGCMSESHSHADSPAALGPLLRWRPGWCPGWCAAAGTSRRPLERRSPAAKVTAAPRRHHPAVVRNQLLAHSACHTSNTSYMPSAPPCAAPRLVKTCEDMHASPGPESLHDTPRRLGWLLLTHIR
jgi:hypothetical protein